MAFGAAGLTTGQHRLPEVAFAAGQACFVHVFQHFDRDIAANAGTVPEVLGGEAFIRILRRQRLRKFR